MKKIIYKFLYCILKNDMINILKTKHYGEQFIDTVMEIFEMPTNLIINYYSNLEKKQKENAKQIKFAEQQVNYILPNNSFACTCLDCGTKHNGYCPICKPGK